MLILVLLIAAILALPGEPGVLRGLMLVGLLVALYSRLVNSMGTDEKRLRRERWSSAFIEYVRWKNGEDA